MTKTTQITCPTCGSDNVVQDPKLFGLLICQKCKQMWQEEDEKVHERKKHPVLDILVEA